MSSQVLEAESLGKSLTGSHMPFPIYFPGVSIQFFIFFKYYCGGVYVMCSACMWGSEVNFVEVILRYLSMCPGVHTSSAGLHCNQLYTLVCNPIFLDWVIDFCL